MRHADPTGLGSRASTPAEMRPATVPRTPASYHGVHLRCWLSDVTRGSSSDPENKSFVWLRWLTMSLHRQQRLCSERQSSGTLGGGPKIHYHKQFDTVPTGAPGGAVLPARRGKLAGKQGIDR